MVQKESEHTSLPLVKQLLYDKCNIVLTDLEWNKESVEYGACTFKLNGHNVEYRESKITPAKAGQFVTVWKRNKCGKTTPFDIVDDIDFIIITSGNSEQFGQFIFPKSLLVDRGIIARLGSEGKRGIRVYPPWETVTSKQAFKTQSWQTEYFINLKPDIDADFEWVRKLLKEKEGWK